VPETFEVVVVGHVRSELAELDRAPNQGDEGAPDVWLEFDAHFAAALDGVAVGDRVILLTWLHEAARDELATHPRGDRSRPQVGVFATRSPNRPNPIGMHATEVLAIDARRLRVRGVEAIDGTPIIDVKPVLGSIAER
jgi:tRNA-Thr(GGU) m(6)t(6)A37 methyltransferase TsaA